MPDQLGPVIATLEWATSHLAAFIDKRTLLDTEELIELHVSLHGALSECRNITATCHPVTAGPLELGLDDEGVDWLREVVEAWGYANVFEAAGQDLLRARALVSVLKARHSAGITDTGAG